MSSISSKSIFLFLIVLYNFLEKESASLCLKFNIYLLLVLIFCFLKNIWFFHFVSMTTNRIEIKLILFNYTYIFVVNCRQTPEHKLGSNIFNIIFSTASRFSFFIVIRKQSVFNLYRYSPKDAWKVFDREAILSSLFFIFAICFFIVHRVRWSQMKPRKKCKFIWDCEMMFQNILETTFPIIIIHSQLLTF